MRMWVWILSLVLSPFLSSGQRIIDFDEYQEAHSIPGDAACLDRILRYRDPGVEYWIHFHDRTYEFEDLTQVFDFDGRVVFEGEAGTRFRVRGAMLEVNTAFHEEVLDRPLERGTPGPELFRNNEPFAAIKVDSRDTVENSWGYLANDLLILRGGLSGEARLEGELHFDYRPYEAVLKYYRPAFMGFRHITFEGEMSADPWMHFRGLEVQLEECSFFYTGSETLHAIVRLTDCHDVSATRIAISGAVTYGFLINGCRQVRFFDVSSTGCFYPIVPATFSTGIWVERLVGLGSVIDAHPSFDVRYTDVTIEDGQYYWNCRALGLVLENCSFGVRPGIADNSIYLGVLNLREGYAYLPGEYDVVCRNVKWSYLDQEFNGLHVHQCRDFVIENCEAHAVSTGMPIRHFMIRNSRIGRVHAADANVTIENTRISPEYQTAGFPRPPLYANYGGLMVLDNCELTGFSGTALFEYIHDPRTEVRLVDTWMEGISHFAERSWAEPSSYDRISFEKCRMNDGPGVYFPDNPSIIVKQ